MGGPLGCSGWDSALPVGVGGWLGPCFLPAARFTGKPTVQLQLAYARSAIHGRDPSKCSHATILSHRTAQWTWSS